MNRDLLKKVIKKLVLQEITNNQFGTPDHKKDEVGTKALEKAMSKDAVKNPAGTGKVVGCEENQHVELSKNSDDCYDVLSVTNGSERKLARGVGLESAMELVKKHAKDSEKTYVQKARDKSINSGKPVKEDKKEEDTDKMEDADEETQQDRADDNDVKAEEKVDKKLSPVNDDVAPSMGGEVVDKIEKIVDRILNKKADAKTAHLKADKEMESPDKLRVKVKDTPALKDSKK
jgi:hypothetical protein